MNQEPALELLLRTWEEVLDLEDLAAACRTLEKAGYRLYGAPIEIALADSDSIQRDGIPVLDASGGEVVAYVRFGVGEAPSDRPLDQLFLRLVSWSIVHNRLRQASQQRQELVEALRVARRILEESLPKGKLGFNGWEITGCLRPALHLGGDLYSYTAGQRNVRFLLADAVGHGLDSTLLVSECRALWRASASYDQDFASEISHLSNLLYENTGAERYVAATFGRCHGDGSVDLILCGQSPQFVLRGHRLEKLEEPDLPLGLFPDQEFRVQQVPLEPGQALLLVSDGVLDLRTRAGDTFGEEGVAAVARPPYPCSQRIIHDLLAAIDHFSDVETARDDICALALIRKPEQTV
ncbi:MAG: serine/threonine-protein phosphatase [Candidatus Eremiobacteraeota bacterium]|nr:serine/threonine-protein phosphatase [Candidatus Eremiobacteraeota bacterium]